MSKILVVDNDLNTAHVMSNLLSNERHAVETAASAADASQRLQTGRFDLLVTDADLVDGNGLDLAKTAQKTDPTLAILIVTSNPAPDRAVLVLKSGAFDWLIKPLRIQDFLTTVHHALECHTAEQAGVGKHIELRYRFENVIAESSAMKQVCNVIEKVAPTGHAVHLYGEAGTRKEYLATALHQLSPRAGKPFIAYDCSQREEPELEAALFGSRTVSESNPEAISERPGLFEAADEGSLFLINIDQLPHALQSRMVVLLKEQVVVRPNSERRIPVDVRLLTTSDLLLNRLVEASKFRQDLFQCINSVSIEIPPLRKCPEDVMPLAYHTIRAEFGLDADIVEIESEARQLLENYLWPNNITELEDVIRQALTLSRGRRITRDMLPPEIVRTAKSDPTVSHEARKSSQYRAYHVKAYLRSIEKQFIRHVLDSVNGDVEQAARALNMKLSDLLKKMEE